MRPKILFGCKIEDQNARQRIEKFADVSELDTCSCDLLLNIVKGFDALIVPYTNEVVVNKAVIDRADSLKLVGTTYGGLRQSIDDAYAIEKGLCLIHTGPTRVRPMAEYALALILSSLLEIHNYHHYSNTVDPWPRMRFGRSRILHNRKVGIIGFGMIGKGICNLLQCFTEDICVCSNHMTDVEALELGVTKKNINEVFSECEVIILSGGHTTGTTHLVGAQQFALMQTRALFVNIARGKMVDEKAMAAEAVKRNIYLALDVFEQEPLPDNSPLRGRDNVLLTPHRANNPIEFEQRWQFLADELGRFFSGQSPLTSLTKERAAVMSES